MRAQDPEQGEVQRLLASLSPLVPRGGRVEIVEFPATNLWRTARVGISVYGGYIELLEDNGELCILFPGSDAIPIDSMLPNGGSRVPDIVYAFAVGAALGSRSTAPSGPFQRSG